ncbi:T9SS type A sorting domain-containing protein [Hymenobacter sp. APR13]|uniref:T9SS type A sorting domain-containing protein n=1 Tax=Hymenobacter sp. APR13 TaxID=1356852 RepID=UPI0009DE0904|nr:T9SS type A sorting domain-containing protein [Hymenobacter sp. APR13]
MKRTLLSMSGPSLKCLWGMVAGSLLLAAPAWAAAPVVKTVGAAGSYATIAQALASIPATVAQPIEIQLLDASYTENVLINKAGTATNTITIRPAAGVAAEITGTLTFGAGSRYVVVSGHNGTNARTLTLRQPAISRATVVFEDDAADNRLSQARVLGSCQQPGLGVVTIGNAATAGNDRNTLIDNLIANASATLPKTLIYAFNIVPEALNESITITDNDLANFTAFGLQVQSGNGSNWNISNNDFFYDQATTPTSMQTAIDFEPGTLSDNNVISGNSIGGRAAAASGGTWVNTSAEFRGIVVGCGSGISTTISNNLVSNVSLTSTTQPLTALRLEDGLTAVAGNNVTNVTNSGQGGVISLNSRTDTDLVNFTVASGQIVNVEPGGILTLTGNLRNDGVLKNAGDVLVTGSFLNSASGTYNQTSGTLEIKGDMNNQGGTFTSVGGLVKLTGSGPQLVSGGVYFNLEINGAGTKTITDDADIISQLTLTSGILATGPHTLELLEQANITESDASYVLGRVLASRTVRASNTELFGGLGLEMTPAASSVLPGATDVLRVTGTAATGSNGSQGIKRYYDVTATTANGLNLSLVMRYFTHELNGIVPANLRFFKSTDAGANWQPRGVSSSGPGYAQLNGVEGFSRWTLGDAQRPLPVGLTSLRAVRQGPQALISWTTASEINNRGFEVEVSTDGRQFRDLGFVPGQEGPATQPRAYQFLDREANKQGLRYYRLRQEDQDGKTSYFGPVTVSFQEAQAMQLSAYPTAFSGRLTVELTTPTATPVAFSLTDALGRVVWQQTQPMAAGLSTLDLAPQCPAGTYILTARLNGTVLRQRVVRQ